MLPGPEKAENLEIAPNSRKRKTFRTKKLVKTKLPDGPRDRLAHWGMSFGHGKDDGKGPKA